MVFSEWKKSHLKWKYFNHPLFVILFFLIVGSILPEDNTGFYGHYGHYKTPFEKYEAQYLWIYDWGLDS